MTASPETAAGTALTPPFVVHTAKGGHGNHSLESAWRLASLERDNPRFYITDATRRRFTAGEFLAACERQSAATADPPAAAAPPAPAATPAAVPSGLIATTAAAAAPPPARRSDRLAAAPATPAPSALASPPARRSDRLPAVPATPASPSALVSPPARRSDRVAAATATPAPPSANASPPVRRSDRLHRTAGCTAGADMPGEVVDNSRQLSVIALIVVAVGIAIAGGWLISGGSSQPVPRREAAAAPAGVEPQFAKQPERSASTPPKAAASAAKARVEAPRPQRSAPPAPALAPDDGGPPAHPDPRAALIARWTFDDADPLHAEDASGRGNRLLLGGLVRVPGRWGQGARSTAESMACMADPGADWRAEMTFMAWLRGNGAALANGTLLRVSERYQVQLTGGWLRIYSRAGGSGLSMAQHRLPADFARDQWRHLALCFRRGEVRVLIDGALVQRLAIDVDLTLRPGIALRMASSGKPREHDGLAGDLDDIRWYAAPLADRQIAELAAPPGAPSHVDVTAGSASAP